MIERLMYDPRNVVDADGNVRSIHDVIDGDIREAPIVQPSIEQRSSEVPDEQLLQARQLVGRVEDQAEKYATYQGANTYDAERQACERLGIPYETYEAALEVINGSRETQQRTVGARSIIEALREKQRAGMSPYDARLFDARNRADDENLDKRVGRPRF